MLDVAIIGSGPAALSAAINCAQRNKTAKIFGRSLDSSLLYTAEKVDNYLGLPGMNGEELLNSFYHHAVKKGVTFEDARITQVLSMGEYYVLNVNNTFVEAKTIILATGRSKSKAIPGEMDFLGKGVSYCATCDGMLYRDKEVLVIAENSEGEEEANFLSGICKKVSFLPLYQAEYDLKEGVELLSGKPEKIGGDGKASFLVLNGKEVTFDGIFLIKNSVPMDSLIHGLLLEGGAIQVNRKMETNLPNVFAAGDCTGAPYQIAKAVGEGLIAALSAVSVK